jgi:hypothetical protein
MKPGTYAELHIGRECTMGDTICPIHLEKQLVQAGIGKSATPSVAASQSDFPDLGFRGEQRTYMLSVVWLQLKQHAYEKMARPAEYRGQPKVGAA